MVLKWILHKIKKIEKYNQKVIKNFVRLLNAYTKRTKNIQYYKMDYIIIEMMLNQLVKI